MEIIERTPSKRLFSLIVNEDELRYIHAAVGWTTEEDDIAFAKSKGFDVSLGANVWDDLSRAVRSL